MVKCNHNYNEHNYFLKFIYYLCGNTTKKKLKIFTQRI